jgi:hypothetical protein
MIELTNKNPIKTLRNLLSFLNSTWLQTALTHSASEPKAKEKDPF